MGQESHRLPKQYRQACRRMHKGQRGIVSRRSVYAGYGYAKSSIFRITRASQVIEGMRWNAYLAYGKATPLFSYNRESLPQIASGIIGSTRMTHEKALHAQKPHAESRNATIADAKTAASVKPTDVKISQDAAPAPVKCGVDQPATIEVQLDAPAAPIQQMTITIYEAKDIPISRDTPAQISRQPKHIISAPQAIVQKIAPQYDALVIGQSQAPAIQSIAIITSNEMQVPDQIPQFQSREEIRPSVFSSPDICTQTIAPAIIKSSGPTSVKPASVPKIIQNALPYCEGPMGKPAEPTAMKIQNATPMEIPKAQGYISTAQKKRVHLRTASAAAGMPL